MLPPPEISEDFNGDQLIELTITPDGTAAT